MKVVVTSVATPKFSWAFGLRGEPVLQEEGLPHLVSGARVGGASRREAYPLAHLFR
ncbi:MAG: hypothetical protein KME30_04880 [Iphinoe sp. HA4291-MV1]|nr:hypothetical protein [Iphinoe sp. HA4291-MV1]